MRMVQQLRREDPADNSVISRVARLLSDGVESLRNWVKQPDIDAGTRAGLTIHELLSIALLGGPPGPSRIGHRPQVSSR